ncbi:hypothetical protein ACVGXF_05260, partial [Enterobacter hormaechei]
MCIRDRANTIGHRTVLSTIRLGLEVLRRPDYQITEKELLAATPAPVPTAIASHDGPIRIAVIRNLGSDDNTTQFVP